MSNKYAETLINVQDREYLCRNSNFCASSDSAQKLNSRVVFPRKTDKRIIERKPVKKLERKAKGMTVCVAAIYENRGIVAIADRQLTDEETGRKSEALSSKIYKFRTGINALLAGDMTLQSDICQSAKELLTERFLPNKFKVKDVVNVYRDAYVSILHQRIGGNILSRYKLTFETYFEKQEKGQLNETTSNYISEQLARYEIGEFQTIIAGVDEDGVHIWHLTPSATHPRTDEGFAAIGAGYSIVESYFDFAKYKKELSWSDVLFISYMAKKRAEELESVGIQTDMSLLIWDLRELFKIWDSFTPNLRKKLEQEYKKLEEGRIKLESKAREKFKEYIENERAKKK